MLYPNFYDFILKSLLHLQSCHIWVSILHNLLVVFNGHPPVEEGEEHSHEPIYAESEEGEEVEAAREVVAQGQTDAEGFVDGSVVRCVRSDQPFHCAVYESQPIIREYPENRRAVLVIILKGVCPRGSRIESYICEFALHPGDLEVTINLKLFKGK